MMATAPVALVIGFLSLISSISGQVRNGFTAHSHSKKVVCYWSTWANYRPKDGKFTVDHLDPNLCTHIIYSFAGLEEATSKIKPMDPWLDLGDGGSTGKRNFKYATELKLKNPELKVTLAIGGWNEGSKKYSAMAADQARRAIFIRSVVDILTEYGFDGLDLDWEYPGKRGGDASDKKNFVLLIKELKRAFTPHGFILTAAIGAAPETIEVAYDVSQIYKYLDFVHVMCYDYHGAWDKKTGHNAPLHPKPHATGNDLRFTVESTWKTLLAKGAKPEKTVMGVPFYGRTFHLLNPHDHRMGAKATSTGFAGPYTRENGFMGYNEICEELGDEETGKQWTTEWDDDHQAPFMYNGIKWVCYDDQKSIRKKVEFANMEGMAGIMIWSVDTDDFTGKCGPRYPLLTSINQALAEGENTVYGGSASPLPRLSFAATVAAFAFTVFNRAH